MLLATRAGYIAKGEAVLMLDSCAQPDQHCGGMNGSISCLIAVADCVECGWHTH